MRRAYGPILTTGVALAASAVVVANPIVAPRADVQIPSVQLSAGSADAADMLDKAFLDAIAPAPPESTNPFSVLKQLISSLAADASYLGKNAIVDAFVAGVTAVSTPELTASATPFADPMELLTTPEVAASVLPGLDLQSMVPSAAGILPPDPSALVGALDPVVKSFVSTVINDAGYVGGELVAAAFAMGAAVAAEPGLISDTIQALFKGDFRGALQNAVKAVTAPLGPSAMVVNAVATVLGRHLTALPTVTPTVGLSSEPDVSEVSVAHIVSQAPKESAPVEQPRAPRAESEAPEGGDDVIAVPSPAAALNVAASRAGAPAPEAADPDAVDAPVVSPRPAQPRLVQPLREAVTSVVTQIGSALGGVAGAADSAADTGKARTGGRGGKAAAASSDDAGR